MPDQIALQRRSPFGDNAAATPIECCAGVTLAEQPFVSKVLVQRLPGAFSSNEHSVCRWDLADNTSFAGDPAVFWTGPAERLLTSQTQTPASLLTSISAADGDAAIVATDVSDALCVVRARGPGTRAMLARCVSIDLNELDHTAERCAQTLILRQPILLHRLRDLDASWDVYFDRSVARTLLDWFVRCAGGQRPAAMEASRPVSGSPPS